MAKMYQFNKHLMLAICSILIFSSMATLVVAQTLQVSTDRYSLFAPYLAGSKASVGSLSSDFKAYALLLDDTGKPLSGINITFEIRSAAGLVKATKYNITQQNGLASVSYDTNADFTSGTDTDYGTWIIKAFRTGSPTVTESTNMRIEAGGKAGGGCGQDNCHKTDTISGKTADVHKNNTCEFCHGNWEYIKGSGNGIPKMPSCTQCHPVYNSNVKNINTLANLLAGNGISVFSFNYDTKTPLVAHNGTSDVLYSLTEAVPCISCHGPAHNNSKPYLSAGNSVTENENCWSCHTDRATTHKSNTNCVGCHTQDAHNVSISISGGGGPDCISCHGTTGSATSKVDQNAMALGELAHANLNSGATATGVSAENKKCWGCHQSDGSQPSSSSMGDKFSNPYKCYECHNTTKPYPNVTSALTVSEHFKSGTDIKSAISASSDTASCLTCHNLSEMKVSYTDVTGTDSSFSSHYGKNRSELRINGDTDCAYCHQNVNTAFSGAMSNVNNMNMTNHSTNGATTPGCTNANCHNTGKIHDASLGKPTDNSDTYCKTCHISGKSEHKGLYCTECHANNTLGNTAGRDIHGIKYLQKDNTFSTSKTNVVDCTTCHQSNVVDSSLGTFTPEKIGALHHSDNVANGSRWDTYWTSSNPIEACIYCHNDTRHDLAPLGRPLSWNSSYIMRTPVGSGTNCADCHFSGDSNYAGMSSTFTGAGLKIPPEITSGSWNGKPGYFNHSLGDYTDATCKGCHYKGTGTTVGQVMHDVSEGGGGGSGGEPGNYTGSSSNCKGCHPSQYDKWAASTHTSKLITKEDAMARGYPNPPGSYSWDNVSFVIGGKWKIRYVNDTGYIITTGGKNQYNVDDQIWTDYNKDVVKKYNCGHCHTTGYLDNVSNVNKEPFKTLTLQGKIPNGVYNNSLTPGFVGYWAENSIGCEACHGQGGDHINSPSKFNIRNASEVRNNPGICGDCHSRPRSSQYGEYENFKQYPAGINDSFLDETLYDDSPMPTVNYSQVGGHHEQWEDWKSSGHANASTNCVSCHGGHGVSDPAYAGGPTGKTKFTNGTVYPAAVNKSCIDCHSSLPKHGTYSSNSECINCHMSMNRKSSNKIDLRSHWFDIKALKDNKNGDIHAYNFNTLTGVTESCTYCHNSSVINKPIYKASIGMHKDVNKSEGIGLLNSSDCKTCHYTSTQTRICEDCHIDQVVTSPKVDEHNSRGLDVKVLEQCSLCHNNSINAYVYTANASVAHYGTTTSDR